MTKSTKKCVVAVLLMLLPSSIASAGDSPYEVSTAKATGATGAPLKAMVTVSTKPGWHLNQEAPITLRLTPGGSLRAQRLQLNRSDLSASTLQFAKFEPVLMAGSAGQQEVKAELTFVICQGTNCHPVREQLTLLVEATGDAVAPAKQKAPDTYEVSARQVIARFQVQIRGCAMHFPPRSGKVAHKDALIKLRFRLTINKEGRVTAPEISVDTPKVSEEFVHCLQGRARELQFPPPAEETSVQFPVIYEEKSR